MARPRKEIDWSDVEKLCALQCTEEEIAEFCEVSVDTLSRRCVEEHEISFAEYSRQKRGRGKISLRRKQWEIAQKGNVTMLIWLGKQYLGQGDKLEAQVTATSSEQQYPAMTKEQAQALLNSKKEPQP